MSKKDEGPSTGPREGYARKRKSLVDVVAEHVNLRRDVVEEVINGFYDIIAERVINERKLVIKDLVSIRTVVAKNGIRPEPHLQYRARVALGLRKILQKIESDPSIKVDRYNWREAMKSSIPQSKQAAKSMNLNDFLQDDDEDF